MDKACEENFWQFTKIIKGSSTLKSKLNSSFKKVSVLQHYMLRKITLLKK